MKLVVLLLAISIGLVACGGGSSGGGSLAVPAVPSGLSWSVIDDNTISLNWDNVSNAAHYIISRNGINPLRNITIADSNYTDTGVIANHNYEYQIAACNARGCSTRATLVVDYFFPKAPSGLVGAVVSGEIFLSWDDVSRATSYAISRRGLDTVSARSNYVDSSVSEDNQYSYSVVSCNGELCSAAAMVTVDYFVPAVPSGLLGNVVSGGITLDWDAVDNTISYTLSRNGTIPLEAIGIDDNRYVDSSPVVNNSYAYRIAACNEVGCSANAIFTANYFPLNLEQVFNIPDEGDLELNGAQSARVAKIDGSSYLFVAGKQDDGVSVFSIADNGVLSNVANVDDKSNMDLELDGAHSVTLANVSGNNYLFVAGYEDRGVSVFSVADDGALANVYNLDDSSNVDYQLREASSVKVANINGSSYLFVAGKQDDGVSVFSVADNGSLTNVDNVDRRDDRENPNEALNGASSVAIAKIDGNSYLFVAARDVDSGRDGGVSVFGVANNGSLENLHNIYDSDNPAYKFKGAISVTVAVLGGTNYLFVAGFGDGVSVFSIAADGSLDNVANVADSDNPAYEIKSPYFVEVAEIGGSSYLFVAGNADDGVSVFSVAADGSLTNVANMATNISPTSVTVAEIGGNSYLFVTEYFDGVSVIKLTQ